jgi:hypothetical protein
MSRPRAGPTTELPLDPNEAEPLLLEGLSSLFDDAKPGVAIPERSVRHRAELHDGLTALFARLNHDLFYGKLPRYRVLLADFGKSELKTAYCSLPERKIVFWRAAVEGPHPLPDDRIRETLLHEMCHIGPPYTGIPWMSHGRGFQRRMIRLYEQGEEWVAYHLEEFMEGNPYGEQPLWPNLGDRFYPWRADPERDPRGWG